MLNSASFKNTNYGDKSQAESGVRDSNSKHKMAAEHAKDTYSRHHSYESAEGLGTQQLAKNSEPILNVYKQRSASPPDPLTSKVANNNEVNGTGSRYSGTGP